MRPQEAAGRERGFYMITVRFLSGVERRLGLPESSCMYEGPSPVSFRMLCEELDLHFPSDIQKPFLVNCDGKTFTLDKAFNTLSVPDGETVVIFMINGGG